MIAILLTASADLPPGEKAHLKDLHSLARETSSYHDVPEHQMDAMVHCLEEKRLRERNGIHSRPVAHVRDVYATAAHVGKEVSKYRSRILRKFRNSQYSIAAL